MSKRQLDNKYEELVKYVNEKKPEKTLVNILDNATRQAKECYNPGSKLWRILEELYTTCLSDNDIIDLVETIIDIYNGNYELEEPACYWRFNGVGGRFGISLYAFKYDINDSIGLKEVNCLNDNCDAKMTKSKLNSLLSNTNLTSDYFTPVEDLD